MNIKKLLLKLCIGLFFTVMLILPLVMMFKLSEQEMSKYNVNTTFDFKEAAYGDPKCVTREDVKLYYTVSGTVTSNTYKYIKFAEEENAEIMTAVSVGDEVFNGEVVAHIGNKEIKSDCNGIVEDIALGAGGYIKIRSFDNLQLTCLSDIETVNKIKNCKTLQLEDGRKVKVDSVSNIIENNQVKIVFSIDNIDYLYGQEIQDLKLYTGKVYTDVLIVDKDCVYQKQKNGPYFVREVDENGYFLKETEVEIGFETEDVVSVLNIKEGTFCDSGYKDLVNTEKDTSHDLEYSDPVTMEGE